MIETLKKVKNYGERFGVLLWINPVITILKNLFGENELNSVFYENSAKVLMDYRV